MTARSLEVVLGWGVAAVAVLTIALDQTAILWTAGAPWVPSVYQSLSVGTSEVGLAAILLYVLIIPSPRHSRPFTVAAKAILASGAVLVVFLSISAIGSIAPRLSLARTGDVILGLLAFATVARRPDLGRWLTIGIAGVTLLEMPFVILQEVKQSTFPVGAFLNQQAIELPSTASGAAVVFGPDGQRWQRAMGTFPHPNVLGGFLALSLVLTLTGIRCSDRAQRYAVVVWILGWLELVFTFSRTALLAVTVACSLWAISRLRARKSRPAVAFLLVPPCLALAIGLTVAGPYIVPRLDPSPAQLTTTPAVVRISLVHVAIAMVKMHPLLGSGAGTFSLA